jgi:hypothetical protein
VQVIGLGAQDTFPYAREFLQSGGLETPTMLWDPSFVTWQAFGIRANSQMMVLSPDLMQGSNLIYGFDEGQREAILELVNSM